MTAKPQARDFNPIRHRLPDTALAAVLCTFAIGLLVVALYASVVTGQLTPLAQG
jgi:hypothetical protein